MYIGLLDNHEESMFCHTLNILGQSTEFYFPFCGKD